MCKVLYYIQIRPLKYIEIVGLSRDDVCKTLDTNWASNVSFSQHKQIKVKTG